MQELRVIIDLDMLHPSYREVYYYIEHIRTKFPGLVKYMSSTAVREPDKENNKESIVRTPLKEI